MKKPRGRVPVMTQKLINDYPEIPENDHICLKTGRWFTDYPAGWPTNKAKCSKCVDGCRNEAP